MSKYKFSSQVATLTLIFSSSYLGYCVQLAENFKKHGKAFRAEVADRLNRPIPTLNRDIRVGKVFNSPLLEVATILHLENARKFLQTYSASFYTAEQRRIAMISAAEQLSGKTFPVNQLLRECPNDQIFLERVKEYYSSGKAKPTQLGLPYTQATTPQKDSTEKVVDKAYLDIPLPGGLTLHLRRMSGKFWVGLGSIIHDLGLNFDRELRKIKAAPWGVNPIKKEEEDIYLDAAKYALWIGTIDFVDISDTCRVALMTYQLEGVEVAGAHAFGFPFAQPAAVSMDMDLLRDINARVNRLMDMFSGTSAVSVGQQAAVIPIDRPEDRGHSANGIAEDFNRWQQATRPSSVFIPVNMEYVKKIAVAQKLVGDINYGHWSYHVDTAHGNNGNAHWRFNDSGRNIIINVLKTFVDTTPQLIAAGTFKQPFQVLDTLVVKLKPVGDGRYDRLSTKPGNGAPMST